MCIPHRPYGPGNLKYLLSFPLQKIFAEPDTEKQWNMKVMFSVIYVEIDFDK